MTTNKLNAVGYCRYSKNEKGVTYTIEQQKEAIEEYATENNYQILKVFTDKNISGRSFERKGLKEMLNYIDCNSNKINVLIVSDVTRLFVKLNGLWWAFKRVLSENKIILISLVRDMSKYIQKQAERHF